MAPPAPRPSTTLLIDAHADRPPVAWYTLGRHLDPLTDAEWSWWGARDAIPEALRAPGAPRLAVLAPASPLGAGVLASPVAPAVDPATLPDVGIRWTPRGVWAEVLCRPGCDPGGVRRVPGALASRSRSRRRRTG